MERLQKLVPQELSGVIQIAKNDHPIFQAAYGYADKANRRKNTLDTKFGIASGGKGFVAVGILKLIEKGVLSFDDSLEKWLALDWKGIDSQITVAQLLTHTSGLPDYLITLMRKK